MSSEYRRHYAEPEGSTKHHFEMFPPSFIGMLLKNKNKTPILSKVGEHY